MNQMFESNQSQLPLAEYLRPKSVSEIAGQKHILGEGESLMADFQIQLRHVMIYPHLKYVFVLQFHLHS